MTSKRGGIPGGNLGGRGILAGVDFSPLSRRALIRARSLAREGDVPLLVLHVIDAPGLDEIARLAGLEEGDLRELLEKERRRHLSVELAEAEAAAGKVTAEPLIAWGRPFEEILRCASDRAVSLIVLGTSGRSGDLERALFGSTAEKVLRASPCPVLCVPAEP